VTSVSTTATLVWAKSAGASTYRLQVATDSTFVSGIVVNDTTIVDTTRQVPGLAYVTRYFWHVSAKNAGGVSAFSSVYVFTTSAAGPPAPTLTSPANLASAQPTTVTFNWGAVTGATEYHFQLATDSTFATGLIKNDSSLTSNNRTVVGLSIYTKYFWRVRAKNTGGFGAYSSTWSFLTAMPVPAQVLLLSPANNAVVQGDSVRVSWQPSSPSVLTYWIDHALDSLFTFVGTDSTADTTVVIHQLIVNKTYYWRVRARNVGGWSPFSATRAFEVIVSGVENLGGTPKSYELSQNYPNPFNPTTNIEFTVPTSGMVRLEIANVLGQQIASLVDQTMSAGRYIVQFNATNLPSGLYFYRLTAGTTVITRKMMLMK